MDKHYNINLSEELVNQVKEVQLNLVGCSNLSAIIKMLLINWLQQFKEKENE